MSAHNPFIKRLSIFALAFCACAVLLAGFNARRTAAKEDAAASAVRPNGKIAYVYQDLYTINPDGLGQTKLIDTDTEIRFPAWSPDASKIAFSRSVFPSQSLDIFVANSDGSNIVRLTNAGDAGSTTTNYGVAWSPDGAQMAFTTFRDAVQGSNIEIYFMDADGSFPTRVTNTTGFEEREPDWGTVSANATPTPTTTPTPFPPAPTPPPFQISGRVTDGTGNGVAGVHVILSTEHDGSRSALTKADGSYQHFYFADTRISLSPAKKGYAFNPSNISYVSSHSITGDKPNTNFTAILFPLVTTFNFSAPTFTFNEGALNATFTVTRSGDSGTIFTSGALVNYRTVDDPAAVRCDAVGATAYARCDYATGVDTLYFLAGESQKTFTLSLINDAHVENTESFALELFSPVGAALGAQSRATVNITDNDAPGQANPIDDTRVFVRQQYLDFLSREPESSGFQAWVGVLDKCSNVNDNPECDRLTVSSSFFLSAEFRLKGYFVHRFYMLSYGRMPRYDEIIPDMRSVSGASATEVFAKRAAFAEAWVARQAFKNLYDAKTNADFVGTLMDRHGLAQITTPDPAKPDGAAKVTLTRAGLTGGLNNQTLTRAQVVRAIVESDEVFAAQFNPAFVAMQYFGYLRRDPDPDYNKWLTYLNEHPDGFRTMVNGFMNSVEYRLRFGQP
ncbi:MAG TPA: Calx-beta domain-containing protein [Pyrinomonadaceae bacterium]|jgi:hypothetical protein